MTPAEFDKILDERIAKTKQKLLAKALEYSKNNDRLHVFKTAARINNKTPAQALWDMSTKQLVSIMDMANNGLVPTQSKIDAKIGDMINYLILLEAIFREKPE